MGAANRISVPALRTLTYTILIKAVISAVIMICTIAEVFVLRSSTPDITAVGIAYLTAQTVGFVNIAACVMCLGGIAALSAGFVSARKMMVTVLLLQCLVLLLTAAGLGFAIGNSEAATAAQIITLASDAAETLLIGVAFLFCMKGFGEVLRNDGDTGSAVVCERLGTVYLYCSIAGVILHTLVISKDSSSVWIVLAVLFFVWAVLELLMYFEVSDAAFRIWRKRAFDYQIRGEN